MTDTACWYCMYSTSQWTSTVHHTWFLLCPGVPMSQQQLKTSQKSTVITIRTPAMQKFPRKWTVQNPCLCRITFLQLVSQILSLRFKRQRQVPLFTWQKIWRAYHAESFIQSPQISPTYCDQPERMWFQLQTSVVPSMWEREMSYSEMWFNNEMYSIYMFY